MKPGNQNSFKCLKEISVNGKNYSFGAGVKISFSRLTLSANYGYTNFQHLSDPKRFSIGLSY